MKQSLILKEKYCRLSSPGPPLRSPAPAHSLGCDIPPSPPPVIEPSHMTGTASECQKCYPPKDEVLVSDFFMYIIYFHPKGEVKRLRENGFSGGCTGRVWGVSPESNKESQGCLSQWTAPVVKNPMDMSMIQSKTQNAVSSLKGCIISLNDGIPSRAEREAGSYVLFLWREEGSISEWWFHQSFLKKMYVGSLCRWFRFAQLAKGKKFRP